MSNPPKYSADTIAGGRRFDAELRARAVPCTAADEYADGDQVVTEGGAAWEPGHSRGSVLGTHPRGGHPSEQAAPMRYVIELEAELPHGRRVIALDPSRFMLRQQPQD